MARLRHRRGRRSGYARSLSRNPYWDAVTRKVRIRDGHRCRICGSRCELEVHHRTYRVGGRSIVGHELEHLGCLVTLCASCHEKVHKGELAL